MTVYFKTNNLKMKKSVFILMVAFFSAASMFAQAEKDLKGASKALSKYFLDPAGNEGLLQESLDLLNKAFESDDIKALASSWVTRGKIYNEIANSEFKAKTLDVEGTYKIKVADAATQAFEAYSKAYAMAEKKGVKKSILTGLKETENHLNNFAIFAYQDQDYATAFTNFNGTLAAADLLKSVGEVSRLDEEENSYNDQLFFAAISGYYGENKAESKPLFEKLFDMGTDEAVVYDALYTISKEEGNADAIKYLEAGREKFPDDTSILFAEINHYLTEGKLEQLIEKLKIAIEKEPDNVSVYTTLGSVYDQLQATSLEAGDEAKASEYFDAAFDYYNQAMTKDAGNFEAIYSMGALYYNKAATYVEKLNEYAADLTPAGMKKYDATKIEMDGLFEKALPFFKQAEGVKANDPNTLIALKEIYARLNDLEMSNAYKAKYEALGGGE